MRYSYLFFITNDPHKVAVFITNDPHRVAVFTIFPLFFFLKRDFSFRLAAYQKQTKLPVRLVSVKSIVPGHETLG